MLQKRVHGKIRKILQETDEKASWDMANKMKKFG
jgi:hypothetical protein